MFCAVAEPRNSGKSAKSREIHKNMQNTAKFGRNLIKYMSIQQFWNLSQLLGVFTCRKHNIPKLPGVDYVVKNWALAMMLKALPLVHFWSVLLKEQMMTSVRKTLKTLVWSAQNRSIYCKICPKITTKSAVCLPIAFRPSLPWKFPRNRLIFPRFCPQKSRDIWLCFPQIIRSPVEPTGQNSFFVCYSLSFSCPTCEVKVHCVENWFWGTKWLFCRLAVR